MSRTSMIDGRMLDSTKPGNLNRFFPQTVTIQQRAAGQDARGYPNGSWSNVTGCVNVPANIGEPGGQATRDAQDVVLHEDQQILLQGYYPQITTGMRASVTGGLTYLILSNNQLDALHALTRLSVERVSI